MYYKSRYHLTNGLISLAIDSRTGEILEVVHEKTGENLIKNHSYALPQPFAVLAGEDILRPGDSVAVLAHPELQPEICISETGQSARVRYSALWDGTKARDVEAVYTVELPEGAADSIWRLSLHCGQSEEPDGVRFPCLNGIYLGDTWTDDTLVYPHLCGTKTLDPVTVFAKGSSSICWRWQDYKYVYNIGTLAQPMPGGLFGMNDAYSGMLSMKWLDYYGDDFGLYFACHDPSYRTCTLQADTFGPKSPGMNFAMQHPLALKADETWTSPDSIVALHAGDWHEGANKYRAFHRGLAPAQTAAPEWFQKSAGLVAHYDFKYQNGGIVHKYAEISQLLKEAEEMGLNHLLISGWHHDGFDNGFPEYYPDSDLGTGNELREQIHALRQSGGHISFYVNTRIGNRKYAHLHDFYEKNGVRLKDGSIMTEIAGSDEFTVHCIGSRGWREKLAQTAEYLTEDIGLDGLYLDQLAMASPALCTNPEHDHGYAEWSPWYQKLLRDIRENRMAHGGEPLCLLYEGCVDSYGNLSAGQLISTFAFHHCGAFPELYRYTFPEQTLVDMLYPRRNLAMRPVHVAQASREMMDRAFVTGMYFWIYDLKDDNTFTRDPESYAYLRAMIRLRKFWLAKFGQGTFVDTDGIADIPGGIRAAVYQLDNALLLACANSKGQEAKLALSASNMHSAIAYVSADAVQERPIALEQGNGKTVVTIPDVPLSLIYFVR